MPRSPAVSHRLTLSKTVSIPKQGSSLNLREEPMRKEKEKAPERAKSHDQA